MLLEVIYAKRQNKDILYGANMISNNGVAVKQKEKQHNQMKRRKLTHATDMVAASRLCEVDVAEFFLGGMVKHRKCGKLIFWKNSFSKVEAEY